MGALIAAPLGRRHAVGGDGQSQPHGVELLAELPGSGEQIGPLAHGVDKLPVPGPGVVGSAPHPHEGGKPLHPQKVLVDLTPGEGVPQGVVDLLVQGLLLGAEVVAPAGEDLPQGLPLRAVEVHQGHIGVQQDGLVAAHRWGFSFRVQYMRTAVDTSRVPRAMQPEMPKVRIMVSRNSWDSPRMP